MLLTLFRHGEVEGRAHVFRGRSDPQLSSAGWEQLLRAFASLDGTLPDRLITSPARRCHEFATHWARSHHIAVEIESDLREIDFGDWEEQSADEVRSRDPELYARFEADPERWGSPNGERYPDFRKRVLQAIDVLRATSRNATILTHAGVTRVLLAEALGIGFAQALRIALPPGSCCRVWYDGPRSHLLALHSPGS